MAEFGADAAAKIEQQAQTLKGKWSERKRRGAGTALSSRRRPTGRRRAARSCAALRRQADVGRRRGAAGRRRRRSVRRVRNADTDAVSILYRRSDGNYGFIEPD